MWKQANNPFVRERPKPKTNKQKKKHETIRIYIIHFILHAEPKQQIKRKCKNIHIDEENVRWIMATNNEKGPHIYNDMFIIRKVK